LTTVSPEARVQLVLSDVLGTNGPSYEVIGNRVCRFADLARRLDFLLAGFGWCKMPPFVVEPYLTDGRLVDLDISDESMSPTATLPTYAAHVRGRPSGRRGTGSWTIYEGASLPTSPNLLSDSLGYQQLRRRNGSPSSFSQSRKCWLGRSTAEFQ